MTEEEYFLSESLTNTKNKSTVRRCGDGTKRRYSKFAKYE